MCERAGRTPDAVATFRDVPMVPATAFASVELATAPAVETFRSSGTLGGPEAARSVHRHPYPDLYRAVVDATFPAAVLPRGERPSMLALIPPREIAPDSSLGFMVDHVLSPLRRRRFDPCVRRSRRRRAARRAPGSRRGSAKGGRSRFFRPRSPSPTCSTFSPGSTSGSGCRRARRSWRPAASRAGQRRSRRTSSTRRLEQQLGIAPDAVVGEYGMTELTSQAYTRALARRRLRALRAAALDEGPGARSADSRRAAARTGGVCSRSSTSPTSARRCIS